MDLMTIVSAINLIILVCIAALGIGIFLRFKKVSRELLKARMFLGDTLNNTWLYSTVTGGFFILHQTLRTASKYLDKDLTKILEITWLLFSISFLYLTYTWFRLYGRAIKR